MFAALPRRMSAGITLVYRASHPRDIVFRRGADAIAADRGAVVHYLIGPRARLGYDPLSARRLRAWCRGCTGTRPTCAARPG